MGSSPFVQLARGYAQTKLACRGPYRGGQAEFVRSRWASLAYAPLRYPRYSSRQIPRLIIS